MIFEANDTFPIDRLTLLTPKSVHGGNYFSRFHIDDSPVFIQLPKCNTKQGIQISGNKKAYTDLQFTSDQERFLRWLETLTEKVQEIVFANSKSWFANEMDKEEIEDTFQSPLKPYRSGQIYLMRVNVPIRMGKVTLPIFDEEEKSVGPEMVKAGGYLLGVLEIQGLKYSAKSLQLEMELKQLLILPSLSLFEKCVLSTPIAPLAVKEHTPSITIAPSQTVTPNTIAPISLNVVTEPFSEAEHKAEETLFEIKQSNEIQGDVKTTEELNEDLGISTMQTEPCPSLEESKQTYSQPLHEYNSTEIGIEEKVIEREEHNEEDKEELQDVDICLEKLTLEPVTSLQLKNSKEIYYKMYRQARQKAKLARDLAISSYLESKHIKNIYVLEDLSDDEDESHFFAFKKPSI